MSETEHRPAEADVSNGAQPASEESAPVQEANGHAATTAGSHAEGSLAPTKKRRRRRRRKKAALAGSAHEGATANGSLDPTLQQEHVEPTPGTAAPSALDAALERHESVNSATTPSQAEALGFGSEASPGESTASVAREPATSADATRTASNEAAAPPTPTEPTEKESARAAQTLAFLHTHASELGLDGSTVLGSSAVLGSGEAAPEDTATTTEASRANSDPLKAIWRVERSLGQALSSAAFRSLSPKRRAELLDAALEVSPTTSVLLARLRDEQASEASPAAPFAAASAAPDSLDASDIVSDPAVPPAHDEPSSPTSGATAESRSTDRTQPAADPKTSSATGTPTGEPRANVSQTQATRHAATLELVRRIESEPGHVEQLLELVDELGRTQPRARYIEWLLAMVENRELKRTLDQAAGRLPQPWRAALTHARIVAAVIVRGQTNQWGARQLHTAVRSVLRSGAESLLSRPVAIRQRLTTLALRLRLKDQEMNVVRRLLESLGGHPCADALALEHARDLLAAQQYTRAATELEALARHYDHPMIPQLRKALTGPRFGSVALLKSRAKPPLSNVFPLRSGSWLSQQVDVWLRLGDAEHAAAFAHHVDVHRRGEIPGVTPIVEHGFTKGNRPYVAYIKQGDNALFALNPAHGLSREDALDSARQLLQLAYGLARCGFVLPDAELARLEREPSGRLWLVETWGSRIEPLDVAQEAALDIVRKWLQQLLMRSPLFALSNDVEDTLKHAGDFATLRATLDVLSRTRRWEG